MTGQYTHEPMMELYITETSQLLEKLEQLILECEKSKNFRREGIDEIFRIVHTIKGTSDMMIIENITKLTHCIEDLFYFIREAPPPFDFDCSTLSDLVFEGIDFIKSEIDKIKIQQNPDGDPAFIIDKIKHYLNHLQKAANLSEIKIQKLEADASKKRYYIGPNKTAQNYYKNTYKAVIHFQEDCGMESIRAYTVINSLKDLTDEYVHVPQDIIDSENSNEIIRRDGFRIYFKTNLSLKRVEDFLMQTFFLKALEIKQLENDREYLAQKLSNKGNYLKLPETIEFINETDANSQLKESIVNVNVSKLEKLMELANEINNILNKPNLNMQKPDHFQKAAQELDKIATEIKDIVLSVRLVSLSSTLHKMFRLVRDIGRKLGKEVDLVISGEETEVDKSIIRYISDSLVHLVRNALDHGIETPAERKRHGKPRTSTIKIEARNLENEILIKVSDDGKGLDKEKIIETAQRNNLLYKPGKYMSDREIYGLIFLPGFSTKDNITEYSGRGVGMDAVARSMEAVGGTVFIDSIPGKGTTVTMKIPMGDKEKRISAIQ